MLKLFTVSTTTWRSKLEETLAAIKTDKKEIIITDHITGGFGTSLAEILADLQGDSPQDKGLNPEKVSWNWADDWDNTTDVGHWEWTN